MSAKETELDIAAVLQSSRKKGGKCRFCLLVLLLCCAAGAFLYFHQQGTEGSGPKMTFTTELVTISDLVVTVTATGTLEPTNEVDVGSELSGNIEGCWWILMIR